jgi:hypothetical protein
MLRMVPLPMRFAHREDEFGGNEKGPRLSAEPLQNPALGPRQNLMRPVMP